MSLTLYMKYLFELRAVYAATPLLISNAVNHLAQIIFSDPQGKTFHIPFPLLCCAALPDMDTCNQQISSVMSTERLSHVFSFVTTPIGGVAALCQSITDCTTQHINT